MFSPEITFNLTQNLSQADLTVIGGINNDYNAMWGQLRNINTKVVEDEVKLKNILSYYDVKRSVQLSITSPGTLTLVDIILVSKEFTFLNL